MTKYILGLLIFYPPRSSSAADESGVSDDCQTTPDLIRDIERNAISRCNKIRREMNQKKGENKINKKRELIKKFRAMFYLYMYAPQRLKESTHYISQSNIASCGT